MPRTPSENPSEQALIRRKQREAKKLGIAKPKGRAKQCDLAKEALKSDKPVEALKKLLKDKKISVAGLKRCFKEDRITDKVLVLLDIKHRKKKETKLAVKKSPVKEPVKKAPKKDKDDSVRGPKKDKDDSVRGPKKGGSGGGESSQTSSIAPSEKLVQRIQEPQQPLSALQFLNRRRFEQGDAPLKPITDTELARAKVLVAEQQKKEFGQSFPEGDPHAKPTGFKTQNPLNTHNNVAGITSTNASIQNQVDKDFEEFTRKLREETKKEAQTNLDSLLSNVDEAVARGFEKAELRLDAPVLGNFVLQGEPTQQSTLQQQSGFNQGNLSQPRTIAQTQLEQDEARVAHHYDRYDHSVISQYASGNPTDVNVEVSSNQDELEPEEFEEESESEEEDEEAPSPISGRMMGLFV